MSRDPDVHVSDHAIIRYLERVQGLDLSDVRAEVEGIVTPAVRGGASAVIRDGFRYVLEGGVVVTVVSRKSEDRWR